MARKTMKSATSLVLMLLAAFQAGCVTAAGPTARFRPDDPVQSRAIDRAPAVDVVTVDHSTIRLNSPEMAGPYLRGWATRPARPARIPLEAIAEIQPYKTDWVRTALGTAFLGGAVWLLVSSVSRGSGRPQGSSNDGDTGLIIYWF